MEAVSGETLGTLSTLLCFASEYQSAMEEIEPLRLDLALIETQGDANLGSVCRLCANFDIDRLHLVNPKNPFAGPERQFACRGENYLESMTVWNQFEDLLSKDYHYVIGTTGKTGKEREALGLDQLQQLSSVFSPGRRVLLVFGRESRGLDSAELRRCDYSIKIPLVGDYPILNLSHAVAIVLYEISRILGFAVTPSQDREPATGTEIMAFLKNLEGCLQSFGYYDKKERHYHRRVLEEVIRRRDFSGDEIRFLQGFLHVHQQNLARRFLPKK
jgi:tRNA/rRNA methyltransferase